jgi:hypothetical protein
MFLASHLQTFPKDNHLVLATVGQVDDISAIRFAADINGLSNL